MPIQKERDKKTARKIDIRGKRTGSPLNRRKSFGD
jgi:hypothetical protein